MQVRVQIHEIHHRGNLVRYAIYNGEYIHCSGVFAPERTGKKTLAAYLKWLNKHL